MAIVYRVNRDILEILNSLESSPFTIPQIRDLLMAHSERYTDKNVTRLFVARHIQSLELKGLISTSSLGRRKQYIKTLKFHNCHFQLIDTRPHRSNSCIGSIQNTASTSSDLTYLEKEKSELNEKLNITLAEIEEYKKLMKRSDLVYQLVNPYYIEATERAATLLGRLNAWNNALEAISQNARSY